MSSMSRRAQLGPDVSARMETSRAVVASAIAGGGPVYGVNTGFGALADTRVGEKDLTALQGAIVRSHAAATGEPLDDATVRAILLLRARTLAAGYSGVRAALPERLLEHLAQPLIGAGRLRAPGDGPRGRPAADVLAEHGIQPLELAPKEGLSLVNGTAPVQARLACSV